MYFWYEVILVKRKQTFFYLVSTLTEVSKNVFLLFKKKYKTDCASVRQESIWLGNSIQGNSVLKKYDWIEVGRVTIVFWPKGRELQWGNAYIE